MQDQSTGIKNKLQRTTTMVSASDVTFFQDNGYLIVRDFLSPEEVTDLKSWSQEIHDYDATETSEFMPYEVN